MAETGTTPASRGEAGIAGARTAGAGRVEAGAIIGPTAGAALGPLMDMNMSWMHMTCQQN